MLLTAHLDGGGAVEAERLGLAVLQVDLQDVRHEEQGVVLHWVLRVEKKKKRRDVIHTGRMRVHMIFMMMMI